MRIIITILITLISITSFAQTDNINGITFGIYGQYRMPQATESIGQNNYAFGLKAGIDIFEYLAIYVCYSSSLHTDAVEPYSYYHNDNDHSSSQYYSDVYLYFSLDYTALRFNKVALYPCVGIGSHTLGLKAVGDESETTRESLLLNAGAGVKYKPTKWMIVFAESRYFYSNPKNITNNYRTGGVIGINAGVSFVFGMFCSTAIREECIL